MVPERPHDPRALSVPGFHHVAFEMESFEDLRRIARYARDNDIPIAGMRTGGPGVQLRVYIWDPDDHMVELFWGLDQIGWDGSTRPYPPLRDHRPGDDGHRRVAGVEGPGVRARRAGGERP